MKINDLLEEVKIGSDDYKKLKRIEQLQKTPEEDKVSYLLKHSIQKLNENKNIMTYLNQAYTQIKRYEEKKRNVRDLRESFARMKFDSLKETYSSLIEAVNSVKEYKNEELLSNSIALVSYVIEELSNKTGKDVKVPELFMKEQVDNELSIIKENL